ncbi:hypothetical protein M1M97_03675, partial [Thermodesulfovibrionales bacterium]|nr:hypothetical protein [Thermodesulfovibrionales bacterium]
MNFSWVFNRKWNLAAGNSQEPFWVNFLPPSETKDTSQVIVHKALHYLISTKSGEEPEFLIFSCSTPAIYILALFALLEHPLKSEVFWVFQ